MFRVVRFDLLLRSVVLISILIAVAAYVFAQRLTGTNISIFKLASIATAVSTVVMFVLLSPFISRKMWFIARFFKKELYPDLNGVWVGQITT